MHRLVHFLSARSPAAKERLALPLARRARADGLDHSLLVFDDPVRVDGSEEQGAGQVPVVYWERSSGLDWNFVWRVAEWLRQRQVGIIHAHNDAALVYAALAVRKIESSARPRVVATFHSRPLKPRFGLRFSTRLASRVASEVSVVSPDLGQFLKRRGWVGRYQTIWNGVDLDEFRPDGSTGGWRERLEVPDGALLIGHLGGSHATSAEDDLIRSAQALEAESDSMRPFVFVLVGDGPDTERRPESLGYNVRFVPHVTNLSHFLPALDLFVSCPVAEEIPTGLLEAMACGLPIVATSVGAVPTLLRGDDREFCGRLVPPRSPDHLLFALGELIGDAPGRAELGRRARQRAESFSFEAQWQQYRNLYADSR